MRSMNFIGIYRIYRRILKDLRSRGKTLSPEINGKITGSREIWKKN
jgi:hypothetical protein